MDTIYTNMIHQLENTKKELVEKQEHFEIMWRNEKHFNCFERNAINDLLIMQQLKSKISELEHWEMMIRVQNKNDLE